MKKIIQIKSLNMKLFIDIILSFIIAMFGVGVFVNVLGRYVQAHKPTITPNIGVLIFCIIIAVGIGTFILCFLLRTYRYVKYIKYIAKEIKFVASQNLGKTLEVRGKDELAELCTNINIMSKELKDKFEYERELERTKSELITNISHDLRTPLTPIIAYLDILRNEKSRTKEEEKEYLNSSYNLSIKLKKLIDELFEYTKLSSNEVVLELAEIDICPILNQITGEYAHMLESKGLRVVTQIPDVELAVKIDVEKMVRVFDNILSNAEKYSSKPSDIVIKVENTEDNIIISFSNQGKHIEQDNLDKLFEKFYRVDTSRSSSVEGSGLGLAISKRIVELHNGQIWAESYGELLTFKIKLQLLK